MKTQVKVGEIAGGLKTENSLMSTAIIFLLSIIMLAVSFIHIPQNASAATQDDAIDIVVTDSDWDDDGDMEEIDDGIRIYDDDAESQEDGWKTSIHLFDVSTGRITGEQEDYIFISSRKYWSHSSDRKIRVYDQDSSGSRLKWTFDPGVEGLWRIDTGDINNDGDDEVFLLDHDYNDDEDGTSDGIRVYDVDPEGIWTNIAAWDTDHKNLKDICALDYNGDGEDEIVVLDGDYNDGNSGTSDGIRCYKVNMEGQHWSIESWDTDEQHLKCVDGGDLDDDGDDELIVLDGDWNDGSSGSSDGFRVWNIYYQGHTYRGGKDTDEQDLRDITAGDLNYGDSGDDIIILDDDGGSDEIWIYSPDWNSSTSKYSFSYAEKWDTGKDGLLSIDAGDLGYASQSSQS